MSVVIAREGRNLANNRLKYLESYTLQVGQTRGRKAAQISSAIMNEGDYQSTLYLLNDRMDLLWRIISQPQYL